MFTKIASVLLCISLCAMVQGDFNSEFTANVEKSIKNLQGINCMVDFVLDLEDAADEFSYQIKNKCGKAANLATELADADNLMKITTQVININDVFCDNAGYDEDKDADTVPSTKCAAYLKNQMADLFTSLVTTSQDINSGLNASYSKSACVKTAMSRFEYILDIFGAGIASCA